MERQPREVMLGQATVLETLELRNDTLSPIIMVCGVPGSGKDELVERAKDELGDSLTIPIINGGTVLSKRLGMDRDEIRNQTLEEGRDHVELVLKYANENAPCVLIAHTVLKHSGLLIVHPDYDKLIRPRHYIMISGDPYQIRLNRLNRSRKRNIDEESLISKHQQLIRADLYMMARFNRAGLSEIINSHYADTKRLRENAKYLASKIKEIM